MYDGVVRVPDSAHLGHPWRIHAVAPDFVLEDVWALDTPGGPEDFPELVELVAAGDPAQGPSKLVGALFAIRWKLGELFGWDDESDGVGGRVPTLRDRLPDDLREGPSGPAAESVPFRPLYLTDQEFAAEIANKTMHGVMHLGWVADGGGGYHGQMAVLVKRNGRLGAAYMAAITPFRHVLVYPLMLREIGRRWRARR
jgi:hypothetical protein